MKKKILLLLLVFGCTKIHANQNNLHEFLAELKLSYFHFQDNTARDIYNEGGFMPSIELDFDILPRLKSRDSGFKQELL